jgi:hypothetical protein
MWELVYLEFRKYLSETSRKNRERKLTLINAEGLGI